MTKKQTTKLSFVRETKMVEIDNGAGEKIECMVNVFKIAEHLLADLGLEKSPIFSSKKDLQSYLKQNMSGIRLFDKTKRITLKNINNLIARIETQISENGTLFNAADVDDPNVKIPESEQQLFDLRCDLMTIVEQYM